VGREDKGKLKLMTWKIEPKIRIVLKGKNNEAFILIGQKETMKSLNFSLHLVDLYSSFFTFSPCTFFSFFFLLFFL